VTNILDTKGSILAIADAGDNDLLPFYSARELTQTMTPIGASKSQRRTINGQLVDLSQPKFRKYASQISARTVRPPAIDKVFPGAQLVIDCAYLLSYATAGGSPSRTVVSGSSFTENGWTFYRPQIVFLVTGLSVGFAEWEADNDWSISLEEV
jgi:hypothetical protein